ncbi:MAG: Crp/Fnr family transcriptional regulator [Microthrixaceae bacterium]
MTGLDPTVRDRLAAMGRVRTLRRGERLIHEGSSGGAVVLVLEGTLRVTRVIGSEEVVLAVRGPGDLLGELGPITGGTARASVEAREAGRVVVMPSSRFLEAQRDDPSIATAIVDRLVQMLTDSDRRLANARRRSLVSRVAQELCVLASIAATDGQEPPSDVMVTQSELASLCIASRSSVAEAVGELRTSGVIDTGRSRVTILDRAELEHLADSETEPR